MPDIKEMTREEKIAVLFDPDSTNEQKITVLFGPQQTEADKIDAVFARFYNEHLPAIKDGVHSPDLIVAIDRDLMELKSHLGLGIDDAGATTIAFHNPDQILRAWVKLGWFTQAEAEAVLVILRRTRPGGFPGFPGSNDPALSAENAALEKENAALRAQLKAKGIPIDPLPPGPIPPLPPQTTFAVTERLDVARVGRPLNAAERQALYDRWVDGNPTTNPHGGLPVPGSTPPTAEESARAKALVRKEGK